MPKQAGWYIFHPISMELSETSSTSASRQAGRTRKPLLEESFWET